MSQIRIKSPRVLIYGVILIPTIFLLVVPIFFAPGIVLYHEILEYVIPDYHRPPSTPEYEAKHWYQAIDLEGIWERTISFSTHHLIVFFFLPAAILLVIIKYYTGRLTKLTVFLTIVLMPIILLTIGAIVLEFCGWTYFCNYIRVLFVG